MISGEGSRLGAEAAHRLALTGRFQMAPGLTDAEIDRVEREYGFEFADDHKAFLQAGLPVNKPPEKYPTWRHPWPDWRDGDPGELRAQLSWPADGALFDVEHNAFWHPAWGPRPAGMNDALDTARRHLTHVPKMIPVYAHRYLPATAATAIPSCRSARPTSSSTAPTLPTIWTRNSAAPGCPST